MRSTVVVRPYFKFQRVGICTYVFRYDYETLTFFAPYRIYTVFIRIKAGLIYTPGLKYMPGIAAE